MKFPGKKVMPRYFLVTVILGLLGLSVLGKAAYIMFVERDYWEAVSDRFVKDDVPVDAERGNIFSADGQLIFSDRGSDWNGGGSSSSRSSSSGSKVCPVCHGRKYSSQAYSYAAGSAAGWMPPYHHGGGSGCPYCNSRSDHYHYPCNECHGTGHK